MKSHSFLVPVLFRNREGAGGWVFFRGRSGGRMQFADEALRVAYHETFRHLGAKMIILYKP